MKIEFRRTAERRYAVTVHRRDQTILEMNPAPGYDSLMPHDLLHYVVEQELGLRSGIFGQLAHGGDGGTFHPVPATSEGRREAARRRRRLARRGARVMRESRRDAPESERAVYVCQRAWLARRTISAPRAPGATQSSEAPASAGAASAEREIPADRLDRVCARLDRLSSQWAGLPIGASMTVEWIE